VEADTVIHDKHTSKLCTKYWCKSAIMYM